MSHKTTHKKAKHKRIVEAGNTNPCTDQSNNFVSTEWPLLAFLGGQKRSTLRNLTEIRVFLPSTSQPRLYYKVKTQRFIFKSYDNGRKKRENS